MTSSSIWCGFAIAVLAGSACAQIQFAELPKRHLPPHTAVTGPSTEDIACFDADGDGDRDLVFTNWFQNWLYLNDGSGIFVDVTATQLPFDADVTRGVAACDVDGDLDLDLVLANGQSQQNRLYLNDGSGTFSDVTAARMPIDSDTSWAVVAVDVDGDLDLDLVFANQVAQNRLYLNDGGGTFSDVTAAQMPVDVDFTTGLVAGDVDGDCDADLMFANSNIPSQNRLYLNDGNGTFSDVTAAQMPPDTDGSNGVTLCDVDADTDLDVVFANGSTRNTLYLNNGSGTFSDATAARMPPDTDSSLSVASADVDSDGDCDLVFANRGQNRVYLNDGTGVFADAGAARVPVDDNFSQVAKPCDVDGDGDPDLVFGNFFLDNRLYLNDGDAFFTDTAVADLPPDEDYIEDLVLGDVDGDGDSDMVLANAGQNRLYLNDGRGVFRDGTAAGMPVDNENTLDLELADVDGDGDSDLVVGNGGFLTHQSRLYLNDGNGVFADVTATHMPPDVDMTDGIVLCDVDGDDDLDLAIANTRIFQPTVQNRLYLNDGNGVFTDVTAAQMPVFGGSFSVDCCDVDGDGDQDLTFGGGFQNRLYLNDGAGTFNDATAQMPPHNDVTRGLAFVDVDADGDCDVVMANDAQSRLYLNDGSGVFSDETAARMPVDGGGLVDVQAGDLDGDGDPDLVFAGFQRQNRVYLNDGSGVFTDVSAARLPADTDSTKFIALGDVDADGDTDLAVGNSVQEQNRLLLNLQRQVQVPFLAVAGHPYRIDTYARYGPAAPAVVAVPLLADAIATMPLPPLGVLGLDPSRMVVLPALLVPQPAGVGSVSFTLVNDPSVVGVTLYAQSVVLHRLVQARLTDVAADTILR